MTSLAYAALWIFVFALPWEAILVIVPGIGVLSKATGALALGAALGMAVIKGRFRRWHAFHVAGLLFVIWLVVLVFLFHFGERMPSTFFTFVQLFVVLWIIWELAPSWDRQVGLLTAYVLGAHVAALGTIMAYLRAAGTMNRYVVGGLDANDLAMTLALAVPMAWYLGMAHGRPLLRWVCRGYLATGLFAIGLTGSRGGMLATVVALLIVPVTMLRLSSGRRAAAIAMLVLAGTLAVAYIPERIVQRLATTTDQVEEGRLSGRGKIWKAGLIAFTRKPVAGFGPGGFRSAVQPYLGSSTQVAHNSYLSVLVEEGLVGFVLYATMVGSVWLAVLKLPTLERRFALVLLATLAVAMLPLTWEDRKVVWFVLAALLGLSQAPRPAWLGAAGRALPQRTVPSVPARVARSTEPMLASNRNARPGTAS
ncbi:MAG TPA: O-antigen ligase family protein [Gemmatimonadales bacterium]|nr:O-antigen ligase family protein [Gemmatimonadales bacterium]